MSAVTGGLQGLQVGTVDADLTLLRIEKTQHQIDDGRLSRAASPDQSDRLGGVQSQTQFFQQRLVGVVSELNRIQFDGRSDGVTVGRTVDFDHLGQLLANLSNPLEGHLALDQLQIQFDQCVKWRKGHPEIEPERHQYSQWHLSTDHHQSTVAVQDGAGDDQAQSW